MIQHYDVSVYMEQILLSGLFEDFYESAPGFWSAEDVALAGATEGDEVEVSGSLVSV